MKLFKNKAMYVEKKDIQFIKYLPFEVFLEMEKTDYYDDNFMKFITYKSIEFFKENEVILDYDYISSLSDEELKREITKIDNYLLKWETALTNNVSNDYYYNKNFIDNDKDFNKKRNNAQYMINTIENYKENKEKYDEMFLKIDNQYTKQLKM